LANFARFVEVREVDLYAGHKNFLPVDVLCTLCTCR